MSRSWRGGRDCCFTISKTVRIIYESTVRHASFRPRDDTMSEFGCLIGGSSDTLLVHGAHSTSVVGFYLAIHDGSKNAGSG